MANQLWFGLLNNLGQTFIDSFNRVDGALGNDWVYTGDWSIVSGELVADPAVTGSNLIVNADFETGDPPTGWTASASNSIAQDADIPSGSAGTKSGKVTVGGSAYAISRSISIVTAGRFYKTTYWGKRGTNTQYSLSTFDPFYENNTEWAEKTYGRIGHTGNFSAKLLGSTGTFFVDDTEVKQLVTSEVFATRDFGMADVDISVKINRTGKDYCGIVLCVDDVTTPTDYITIGIESYDISAVAPAVTLRIVKVVGGVYTAVQNYGLLGYTDDKILRVVKNGTAFKFYYDGIEYGEDAIITDAGLISNTKHGLFSTGSSTAFDDFQFTPYSSGVDETPIFTRTSSATLWSTSGAKDWLGWPQLRKISSSRWVMTYVASTGHIDNDLTTTIHIRFSDDEGATWTNEDTKLGGGAVTGFPMQGHGGTVRTLGGLLIVCPNGDLLFHQYDNTEGTYQWRSEDDGDTWVDEGLILDSRFISLDDWKIVGSTIYINVNYTNNSGEPWVNSIYKSSDNGTTWSIHGSSYESDGDEAGLVICPNGDWVIVMRDNNNAETYQFRSTDGGLTWGAKTVRADLYILQRPRMELDGAGGIILHGRNYVNTNQQQNVLYYSNDNGVTWGRRFLPFTTVTGDGNYNGYIIKDNGTYYMITYSGTKVAAGIKELIFSKQ
jgi:hypothetical protein